MSEINVSCLRTRISNLAPLLFPPSPRPSLPLTTLPSLSPPFPPSLPPSPLLLPLSPSPSLAPLPSLPLPRSPSLPPPPLLSLLRLAKSWPLWCWTNYAAMVCWRASESAGLVFPTASSSKSSANAMRSSHLGLFPRVSWMERKLRRRW